MIGRDFSCVGDPERIYAKLGDGLGTVYKGPLRVKWLTRDTLAAIDTYREVYIQSLSGQIMAFLPSPAGRVMREKKKQTALTVSFRYVH